MLCKFYDCYYYIIMPSILRSLLSFMLRGLSVCQLDATLSPTKMAKPIEVLFVLWTWVHPSNHILGVGGWITQAKRHFVGVSWHCIGIIWHEQKYSVGGLAAATQAFAVSIATTCYHY